jgi:hypothetical protein
MKHLALTCVSTLSLLFAACSFDDRGHGGPGTGADAGAANGDDSGVLCGDGVCSAGESCSSCPADCGECTGCTPQDGPVEGIDYATQIQPIFAARCTGCHGDRSGLSLRSYEQVLAGGNAGPGVEPCDCENSIIWQKISPNPPFGDRMPDNGPPYLSDAEQQRICDWINQGAGQTYEPGACGDAPPPPPDDACTDECGDGVCSDGEDCESCPQDCGACETGGDPEDTTPPTFGGITDVDEISDTACAVYFEPATDDVTPSHEIVYDVYVGPRGEVDLSAPFTTLDNAQLTLEDEELVGVVTLPPGERYGLIVRARDAAGNSDDNTEEDDCDLR